MDLTSLVQVLQSTIVAAQAEKDTTQADIDAKSSAIVGLQSVQGVDDVIMAGAQAFLATVEPYFSTPLMVDVPA